MSKQRRPVKAKLSGDNIEELLAVSDSLRNLYAPNVIQSEVKASDQGGFHCFLTVYVEEAEQ